ncbi:Uncharacterized protein APZ42_033501 [Daphnia magna]|uniref:Uncharacterized protein n=1 Tax=Daphnia magna TaxID=35525 RepID=A0A164L110_9CRUS|nr:Uncharacterized protein APZ42_033501 [Daphnia magna]
MSYSEFHCQISYTNAIYAEHIYHASICCQSSVLIDPDRVSIFFLFLKVRYSYFSRKGSGVGEYIQNRGTT